MARLAVMVQSTRGRYVLLCLTKMIAMWFQPTQGRYVLHCLTKMIATFPKKKS